LTYLNWRCNRITIGTYRWGIASLPMTAIRTDAPGQINHPTTRFTVSAQLRMTMWTENKIGFDRTLAFRTYKLFFQIAS
jgi:hypothetical protein